MDPAAAAATTTANCSTSARWAASSPQEFPKIAGRLGLDGFECADPYVERLLEGFGFLAGRVQLKLDAEFPRFTQHLLEMVYPHYLAPTPSMAVVQLEPDLTEGSLAEGFEVPAATALRSVLGKGEQTACEYRDRARRHACGRCEIVEAEYFIHSRELFGLAGSTSRRSRPASGSRLRAGSGRAFSKLALERADRSSSRGPGELRAADLRAVARQRPRRGGALGRRPAAGSSTS